MAMSQTRGEKNYNSVGSPAPLVQAKIVALDDEKMIGLGPNQVGEIFLRSAACMLGYLNNPKATKETLVKNRWLRTGDIGYFDDNKNFYITDRLKELIKVKGFQVAPAEIEAILRSHPEVIEAAVIGIPDPKFGEVPKAFVVAKDETKVSQNELQEFVKARVVEYKTLRGGVAFIDMIPKNPAGKIMRRELKKLYFSKL